MSTRKFGDFFNEDDDDDALVGKLEVVTPSVTHVIKTAEEKFNTYGLKTVSPDALPDTTHKGVAEYLLQHGPAFKYAADNEALYVWDGARFSLQDSYFAFFRVLDQLVADVADALDVERGGKGKRGKKKDDEEETPRVKYLKELLRKLKTKSFAKDVLEYLKFQPSCICSFKDFDQNDYLFNAANGIVDLRSKMLYKHHPAAMFTRVSKYSFDPAARVDKFLDLVADVTCQDVELIEYLQIVLGLCITGEVGDQLFYIFHGDGNDGKSQMISCVDAVLGDFAHVVDSKLFLHSPKGFEPPKYELENLVGKRFVTISEAEKGAKLDLGTLKTITGESKMPARQIRSAPIVFEQKFKVVMLCNDLPEVGTLKRSAWRRIIVIPCEYDVPLEKMVLDLWKEIMRAEGNGVLTWLVDGAFEYYRQPLKKRRLPARVVEAIEEYKMREDELCDFISSEFVKDPESEMTFTDVYSVYLKFMKGSKAGDILSRAAFAAKFSEYPFKRVRKGKERTLYVQGLKEKVIGSDWAL